MSKIVGALSTSTVNLTFRYSELDYVRGLRAHYGSRLRWRLDTAVAVGVGGLGICLLSSTDYYWLGLFNLVVALFLALVLIAAFIIIPPFAFRREPKFRDEYSLIFSPEGIHFRTVHIDSRLQWNMYSRALIDEYSYVLYYGQNHMTVIPKRVFQDIEQQRAFEQMLDQHIADIVRKAP